MDLVRSCGSGGGEQIVCHFFGKLNTDYVKRGSLTRRLRSISRRMTLGSFRKFQADDYLMMVVLCFYTNLIATINIVRDKNSNLLPPGFNANKLTKQGIQEREYGSKLILVVEQSMCVTQWGTKACLIILYMRLTTFWKENIAIKILAGYVGVSFVVMDILYFGVWCRPFHDYWAVPTPNPQCDAATNHLITNAVFNLSSDCAMLAIGLPMFLRMTLPWNKKIPLIGIFSLGIFTILSAILNKWYSFTQPFGGQWTYWYTRESSTAMLVANLPFVWTFWRRITGAKTVHGQTRQNSDPSSLTANDDVKPTKSKLNSTTAADGLEDLEMEESRGLRTGRGMSFAEMLGADGSGTIDEKEATPITHPQLFYGKNMAGVSGKQQEPIDAVVLDTVPEWQTVHGDSSPADRPNNTPASSVFPRLRSKESARSFV